MTLHTVGGRASAVACRCADVQVQLRIDGGHVVAHNRQECNLVVQCAWACKCSYTEHGKREKWNHKKINQMEKRKIDMTHDIKLDSAGGWNSVNPYLDERISKSIEKSLFLNRLAMMAFDVEVEDFNLHFKKSSTIIILVYIFFKEIQVHPSVHACMWLVYMHGQVITLPVYHMRD